MTVAEIPFSAMGWMYALLLLPLGVCFFLQLGLIRETLIALARMSVQLLLVGLYLKYLFEINQPLLSLLWLVVMIWVANGNILGRAGLPARCFFVRSFFCIALTTLLVSGWFIGMVIRPEPFYDARYLIPVTGMILGNCMNGNVLSLERFYSGLRENEEQYLTRLMLGATLHEAVRPWMRTALRTALSPSLATMAAMGIVSLPGMMTGQILGGSLPLTAIKYQIGIMICIYSALVVSAWLNLRLSLPVAFDCFNRLRSERMGHK